MSATHPRFPRITSDPDIFGGEPTIRRTRFAASRLLAWLAVEGSIPALLGRYPALEREDVLHSLALASDLVAELHGFDHTGEWSGEAIEEMAREAEEMGGELCR